MAKIIRFMNDEPQKTPVLSQVLVSYSEESITEEQVQRVLKPVVAMIYEGRFDESLSKRYSWAIKPMVSMIAVGVLIVIVWMIG